MSLEIKERLSNTQTTTPVSKYQESSYRYVNLAIYILAALVNSLPSQIFASINNLVSKSYNLDPLIVSLFTFVFPILHPICAFPANWILDKCGIKIGCIIGAIFLVSGVWMRTFIRENQPVYCLIGSILAAIGNVFVLNSPSIVANNWFKS